MYLSRTHMIRTQLSLCAASLLLSALSLTQEANAQAVATDKKQEKPVVQAPDAPQAFPDERARKTQGSKLLSTRGFEISLGGYAQARYQRIQDDPQSGTFIGQNDGFGLSNARLNLEAQHGDLSAFFSIEGARDRRLPNNRAEGDVRTMMLDAYFTYSFSPVLRLQIGRFKPAFDANELESTSGLFFADRALESRGVLGVEGLNVAGLSLARQVGAQLNGVVNFDQAKNYRLKYFLSFTNGNSAETPLNDNDSLAISGRIVFNLRVNRQLKFKLGGGAYFVELTEGELPDLISEERMGVTADAAFHVYALRLKGQWMQQVSTYVDVPQEPRRTAQGYHAIAGLDLGMIASTLKGIMPAYRFAYYDPTYKAESDVETLAAGLDADALTHHTVGLNVFFDKVDAINEPLKLQINYTWAQEQSARAVDNDRLDILLQMSF